MTINYRKLNQVVAPTAAVLQDIVLLLEMITKASGTWYADTDLENALFSILIRKHSYESAEPQSVPPSGDL